MLNKVILIGYAGADSEMKFTAAGIPTEQSPWHRHSMGSQLPFP
jgi:hypothetical protein